MQAVVNAPYPNRIQLLCAPLTGPFGNIILGPFDPRRDLEIYVDGKRLLIDSFEFDVNNNRYLLYTNQPFNLQGVIQVIHHMPNPPFHTGLGFGNNFGFAFGE